MTLKDLEKAYVGVDRNALWKSQQILMVNRKLLIP